jgi:RNA polymerase sigma factor (sigma-70 family)
MVRELGSPGREDASPQVELVRSAVAGDAAATARLLEVLTPRLAGVARAVMGRAHPDLEDTLQQTLIAFVQALPTFRGECDPAGFATVIAVRTALAARERASKSRARHDDETDASSLPSDRPSPGEEAVGERRREIVRQILSQLPFEQAESLALRFILGWSLQEIADHTGAPLNTVRSRLRLAKVAVRRRIVSDAALLHALEVDP